MFWTKKQNVYSFDKENLFLTKKQDSFEKENLFFKTKKQDSFEKENLFFKTKKQDDFDKEKCSEQRDEIALT